MLIAILAWGDLRSTTSLWGTQIGTWVTAGLNRKNHLGGFRCQTWFRPSCSHFSLLLPVVDTSPSESQKKTCRMFVRNLFPDPMSIVYPGRLLEFKQGILYRLMDCQRSTVGRAQGVCLNRRALGTDIRHGGLGSFSALVDQ